MISLTFILFELCFFSLLALLPACNPHAKIVKRKLTLKPPYLYNVPPKVNTPPLTVWIHGTRFFSSITFEKFFNCQACIKHATEIDNGYNLRSIANILSQQAPDKYPLETFYIFAWSGKLNAKKRKYAAKKLYKELNLLIADYKKQYQTNPYIQLLAHSHGGNVILNMAKIKKANCNLKIDEVILLATPVQSKTMHLVGDPMFKHIYNFYSSLDMVQVFAPQMRRKKDGSTKYSIKFPPFSDRRFPASAHIAQAKIKVNGRSLFHNEFVKPIFLKLLPNVLQEIKTWQIEGAAQYDKGHDIRQLLCVYTKSRYIGRRERGRIKTA